METRLECMAPTDMLTARSCTSAKHNPRPGGPISPDSQTPMGSWGLHGVQAPVSNRRDGPRYYSAGMKNSTWGLPFGVVAGAMLV
jgi:hypothetical protein